MTLSIGDDEITSSATSHRASRCPGGWAVTWLADRTVAHHEAVNAMLLAEAVADPSPYADEMIRSFSAELLLGMTLNEVKGLVTLTLPSAPVHDTHAIPAHDTEDRDICADGTCGECTNANVEPKPATAAEINPGDLFADADDDEYVAVSTGPETFLVNPVFLFTVKDVIEKFGPLVKYLSDDGPISAVEPAKTHDLSILRAHGNVVIEVTDQTGSHLVYLQEGVGLDLGRVLAALTPAQREVLIDDLTGGAS